MTSHDTRQKFLDFFDEKGHKIVSSAPIILKNDPTLMFTNAGMNQFKDYFLGSKQPQFQRVTDTQKCLRVSGKHNDLEEVGKDTYHHTMFEMLGNWSFGDYFKKEAIDWAWELLTSIYGIDKDRLYVTAFEGNEADELPEDTESRQIWKQYLPDDRILNGNKKDNFWEMGNTGPCGPSSEIHFDNRSSEQRKAVDGATLVNTDNPEVVEIWNLVFIQYNRKADGSLEALPAKHVDTGMGFERLCAILQEKKSNYDTDVFSPLITQIEELTGKKYGISEEIDVAIRVIADHIRAITFSVGDGQLPSNSGAGYVIRRILRRALRYGYSYLDMQQPFLHELVKILSLQFENVFPEIKKQESFITKVILEEEKSFLKTLETGLKRLKQIEESTKGKLIPGEAVFELYDTFGFPADLTGLIAAEHGFEIDQQGFDREMIKQKTRSRTAGASEAGDWTNLKPDKDVAFSGYDKHEVETGIIKFRKIKQKNREAFQVVLEETPFYAESGGQTGDSGEIRYDTGVMKVLDTKKENELIVHITDRLPEAVPAKVIATIDKDRRNRIAANHSATHLLHAALRKILGKHVEQRGSFVGPDHLRFDFSHFEKISSDQIRQIEELVNEKIRQNIPKEQLNEVPIAQAMEMGAMSLFGEKYGEFVRVVSFDRDYSIELCGGTHVNTTGEIGLFKIISESAIAAGIRRIEAITGNHALEYVTNKLSELDKIGEMIKNPNDLVRGVQSLLEENILLKKQLEKLNRVQVNQYKEQLKLKAEKINDMNLICEITDLPDGDSLKDLSFELRKELENACIILGVNTRKPLLSIMFSDNLVKDAGLHAGQIIREAAKEIRGGGGGQPFYATAGGSDASGLKRALSIARRMVLDKFN